MLDRIKGSPKATAAATAAQRVTLRDVWLSVEALHAAKRHSPADVAVVKSWLNLTQSRFEQMGDRLIRLKNWIDLYNAASEAAQESIRLQEGWLTGNPPGSDKDWETLAYGVHIGLSPIRTSCGHCTRVFKERGTGSFADVEATILHGIGQFKKDFDRVEASLKVLQSETDETKRQQALKLVQDHVAEMVNGLVGLCQLLYHAITDLVDYLGKPIKALGEEK